MDIFYKESSVCSTDARNPDRLKYFDCKKNLIGFSINGNMDCASIYFNNKNEMLGYTVMKGNTIYRLIKTIKNLSYIY